jgi:hypothetical protein
MEKCSFPNCHKKIELLPYTCKFCGKKFCFEHRLPEYHNCYGLKLYKKRKKFYIKQGKPIFDDEILKKKNYKKEIYFKNIKNKKINILQKINFSRLNNPLFFLILCIFISYLAIKNSNTEIEKYGRFVFWIILYGVEIFVIIKIIKKIDEIFSDSDISLFLLNIASAVSVFIGIFIIVYTIILSLYLTNKYPKDSGFIITFFLLLGFLVLFIGAYLAFKFKRRTGLWVYHGRI